MNAMERAKSVAHAAGRTTLVQWEEDIAAAIRAAENEALEDAARRIEDIIGRGAVAEAIRSLKIPDP